MFDCDKEVPGGTRKIAFHEGLWIFSGLHKIDLQVNLGN